MARKPAADRLTSQLNFLPGIVGQMGLSIANAQKTLNVDYVENVAKLMGLIERTVGPALESSGVATGNESAADEAIDQRVTAIWELVRTLAPARYQFTETTIDFSADLAESKDLAASGGLGVGLSAVTVNAGLTLGYGYDYRAAARITSVLHAREVGADLAEKLLERATTIRADKLDLPELTQVEKELWDQTSNVANALFGLTGDDEVPKVKASEPTEAEE